MALLLHNTQQQPFTAFPNHKENKMADTKIIVNCETGEVQELELTADEVAQREADAAAYAAQKAQEDADAQAKADAKAAIAKRLGLTADDLATLLG
jgi:hypothetical protein